MTTAIVVWRCHQGSLPRVGHESGLLVLFVVSVGCFEKHQQSLTLKVFAVRSGRCNTYPTTRKRCFVAWCGAITLC